ncbi:MAG: tetratricopeptide repeat protein [Acidobacteria bacterium]|nr:tetratricopeptide repeat protein [Acidobacteriota bacterium]
MNIWLARVLIARQEYGEAAALLRRSLAELEGVLGTTDVNLVPILHLLGRCLWRTGDVGGAQLTLQRAGNLTTQGLADEIKPESEFRPSTQNEQDFYQGDVAGAALAMKIQLEFEAAHSPSPDPDDQPGWETLGEIEEAAGNVAAARDAYEKALEAWKSKLAPTHPRTNWARERLAALESCRVA